MGRCPNCGFEVSQPFKEWRYGPFRVQAYRCENCGTEFREYYGRDGKLSFKLKLVRGRGYVKA